MPDPVAMRKQLGASPEALRGLVADSGLALPQDYLDFLAWSNGWEGLLGVRPGWIVIWPAEDVIDGNEGIEAAKWVPGFFGIGSNGAGEWIAFDTRQPPPWPIVMIPYIPLDPADAWPMAPDFATLVDALGQDYDDNPPG